MSSDRPGPGAIWQGSAHVHSGQTFNQVPSNNSEDLPPPPNQQQAGAYYPGTPLPAGAEDEQGNMRMDDLAPPVLDEEAGPTPISPIGLLKQSGQFLTTFLVPLLFGALTCLFVLPTIATGHAKVPAWGFWPVLFVIIAIAVAQGAAIYLAGSDNGLWALATVGGFFLFVVVGSFALFGLIAGVLVMLVLLAVGIVLARRCIHPVPQGYADIVFSVKKYSRTLQPGFNVLLPWEEIAAQLNVTETQWMCPAQTIQLSRQEDVILRAVISYQLQPEDAYLAVTQVNNWEESVRTLFITTLQTITTIFKPEDFLSWPEGMQARPTRPGEATEDDFRGGLARRERINTYLFQLISDRVAMWGVQINWVSIRDVELAPHGMAVVDINPAELPIEAIQTAIIRQEAAGSPPLPVIQAAVQQTAIVQQPMVASTSSPAHVPQYLQPTVVVPPSEPGMLPQLLKEEFLIKIYKEVQDGHITDPDTIRDFANKFELVAKDPQASQAVTFDAARAALNLFEQARKYEVQFARGLNDPSKPDWKVGPPR